MEQQIDFYPKFELYTEALHIPTGNVVKIMSFNQLMYYYNVRQKDGKHIYNVQEDDLQRI